MNILLFQIYGRQRRYQLELTYSVLSAARFLRDDPSDVRLVLASDEPNLRPDLPVEPLPISPPMLREWQMGGTYSHAIQAYLLHHAVTHFGAPTILIDTDTIVHAHPRRMFERIGPGRTLMHTREGLLRDSPERAEWEALISRTGGDVAGYSVGIETVMHNAGVLGLHPHDADLMGDVKAVMRQIRDRSEVFTAVQLAASLVFGSRTGLSTSEDLVEHYWAGPRSYYRYQINRLFPDVLSGGGIGMWDPPLAPLRQTPPRRIGDRIAARIKRMQRGGDREYGSAYLAYRSALSARGVDVELANVWAAAALDMLIWGMRHRRPETARDFSAFAPASLDQLDWMTPELRSRWRSYWDAGAQSSATSVSAGEQLSER